MFGMAYVYARIIVRSSAKLMGYYSCIIYTRFASTILPHNNNVVRCVVSSSSPLSRTTLDIVLLHHQIPDEGTGIRYLRHRNLASFLRQDLGSPSTTLAYEKIRDHWKMKGEAINQWFAARIQRTW